MSLTTTSNLWSTNTPEAFWRSLTAAQPSYWEAAIEDAAPILALRHLTCDSEELAEAVLGEARFGSNHWRLSFAKQVYYSLKPLLLRTSTLVLRRYYWAYVQAKFALNWPIEERYPRFLWRVMQQVLEQTCTGSLPFIHFWPDGHRYAFVLTHDIESVQGQDFVREVAALEERYGFRSSFNFVPELYPIDDDLMRDLRTRGFEVGIHGLDHKGSLFNSREAFMHTAERINKYIHKYNAVGFRSPLTHRQPEWMQALDIEYDLSFFDTDPFESMPGGTMSIWPFQLGRFVELPYTLVQDYTLNTVLEETTAALWLRKVDFIERYYGMALLNSHPDYLREPSSWAVYEEFLRTMRERVGYWHALPRDVARWWKARSLAKSVEELDHATVSEARFDGSNLLIHTIPHTGSSMRMVPTATATSFSDAALSR